MRYRDDDKLAAKKNASLDLNEPIVRVRFHVPPALWEPKTVQILTMSSFKL